MMRISPPAALFTIAFAASLLPAQSWSQRTPAIAPSARRAGAMEFDIGSNRVVLNGGTISSPGQIVAETWVYGGGIWTQLNAPAPARWGHQLVRDTFNGRLITFGGRSPGINGLANDTWAWSGTAWSQLTTTHAPSRRFRYGMVFDSVRNRVVLFGGRATLGDVNDTWEFDGTDWAERVTATQPPKREDMVLEFDADVATTVLFGGYDYDTSTLLGDTWEYRGTDWVQVPTTGPSPRYRCAAAYDSTRKRVLFYGGWDGSAYNTQTYEYTGSSWELVLAGPGSANSTEMYVAFDPARDVTVTFGGVGAQFSDETWEFGGDTTAFFGAFGTGCPHSNGISTITGTTPTLGTNLDMEITAAPTGTTLALVVQGFSATSWTGGPLPFDLSGFGLVGCSLQVADDATLAVLPNGTGQLLFGFTIPVATQLVNQSYFAQAFIPDTSSPNGLGAVSQPCRAVFGL
ncbi:MAG: hypothetical protein KDC98_22610 [Planctomycetes bacterium]|nr:hypothetical protein [Planctomycetota bacterium]